ncbi:type IV pilus twitching motility protein PilT [Galbitalea sp. SE-J8]|uniref:type IV pilus twitching motility protein PilT n=1 Tax=Galbitalea sp. SE-J8 TaxID=3054952 RepID=UPI00259C9E02|nr:type IV pilus twitching motility protein PilT [Galbitalea sp. SE-J8]MDM4761531.1 type IV pilus twitching motility protein PilT [Galbitalea sp. SE-J8]
MADNIFEIPPLGDGDGYPPATSRRAARAAEAAAPGAPASAGPAPSTAGFDPSAFPPPPTFSTTPAFPAADAAPAFPAFDAPVPASAPAFDASAYGAPAFDVTAFDASAYAPPVFEVPATPPAFGEETFDAPAPPSFDGLPNYEGTGAAPTLEQFAPPSAASEAAAPATTPAAAGTTTTTSAAASATTPASTPGAAPASRIAPTDPQPGEGQEGSHKDIVEALNQVVLLGASDLHVAAGSPPLVRLDGSLRPVPGMSAWSHDHVSKTLTSLLTEAQEETFLVDLELDFAYQLSPSARFRVNLYQQRNHYGAAFRLIPTTIKPLDQLGVPAKVAEFAGLARGLVLVTGPTGSGKSTTLASLIDVVNSTRADHIMTVEDPIEFMHENKQSLVNQREVGHDTVSFQNALKHVLRQDPDVILIGELRDLETISTALTAAETGHLVFATLHTQDAAQSIDRILDVFPPHQQALVRTQLAGTLQGIVSQTLVKKIGGGRAVATEVLVMTPAISNLIREGKVYQIHSAMQAGRDLGMHTMDQHLADLVNMGQISHAAAYEKAHDMEDIKQLIQRGERASQGGYGVGGQF